MMGYYQGDWYGGARGDPFWGSLISGATKIFSKVTQAGQKLLAKGGGIMPGGNFPPSHGRMIDIPAPTYGGKVGRFVMKHPVLSGAGAAGALASGAMALHGRGGRAARLPGMHHRRRMNVCNPRALRRAIRRTHGFARLAMKTIHLVHPKKHAKFGGFKKKRKR
jgi:hypothetical protein